MTPDVERNRLMFEALAYARGALTGHVELVRLLQDKGVLTEDDVTALLAVRTAEMKQFLEDVLQETHRQTN